MARVTRSKPEKHTPFADNLQRIIDKEAGGSTNAWCKSKGLAQNTVSRYLRGASDPQLAAVEMIAGAANYEPWQLLHPDFDPYGTPPMVDHEAMRVAAIFSAITSEPDRRRLRAIVEQFEDTLPKEPVPEPPKPLRLRGR
jgi:transcriptional regulator with XRE-family HTH domain